MERYLAYFSDIGYRIGFTIYYKKHQSVGEVYKLLLSHESIKELRVDAIKSGFVSIYVDHCAKEK